MDEQELIEIIKQTARDRRITLNLSGEGITAIPIEIEKLTSLHVLNLSNNQITAIPIEIEKSTNLQELNLSNNKITAIPT
jgi:Leucine-rich repeat (LRR) protein